MFEISILKEMKLSELQEIAKAAKINKITGVKKENLITQILDLQAASATVALPTSSEEPVNDAKPKRARMVVNKKAVDQKEAPISLFTDSEVVVEEKKGSSKTRESNSCCY